MIVDANVFLEVMLDQGRRDACKSFLERVRSGEVDAFVTAYHVDAVAYVIGETADDGVRIRTFLTSLLGYDGLSVLTQPITDKVRACQIMDEEGLDFDDALAVQATRATNGERVVTLDSDFRGVAGITPVDPGDV